MASPAIQNAGRAERAEDGPCDRELRLVPGVVRHLLERDQRAEERDEERSAHRQSLALRLEHVAHLVDEEQDHEADPEPPAAEPDVERGRDEHGEEELELEEDAAELDEQRADGDERGSELPQEREARLVLDGLWRLVVRELGEPGAFFWREFGHELIVARGVSRTSAPKVRRNAGTQRPEPAAAGT